MRIKKTGGKIYGASLSAAEQKAMDMEIQRQLAEYDRKHELEIDAMILWVLHERFGFGPKRLRLFYDNFTASIDALIKRYEMENSEHIWICTYKLKKYGVDVSKWNGEKRSD